MSKEHQKFLKEKKKRKISYVFWTIINFNINYISMAIFN